MNILFVAATESEINPFLKARPSTSFLITGVGAPMAVYHILKRLHQSRYDMVIQAGIAGSFSSSLDLGKVVFVEQDNFADLGIYEQNNFSTLFEKDFANLNGFPFSNGWLKNNEHMMDIFPLKKVIGITVNTVTDDAKAIKQLSDKFQPAIETMEGAALHYVCLLEGIPFIQLRSISNYVGERNKTKWKMKEAIGNLNDSLLKIADHILAKV